jgi:GPI mannosyltransferase 3
MRKAIAAIIATVAIAQLWLAHRYFGFMTGDDVEVLSEAFRRARGLDFHPWDIRNLFVPDVVVAPVVWIASKVGISNTRTLILASVLPFIALTSLTIVLIYRLTLRWCGDERAALVASLLFAMHWIPLGFGSTVYPRTLAAACVVGAALIVERWPFVAGALVGVAFADRFSEIVFLAPLLIAGILSRRSTVEGHPDSFRAGGEKSLAESRGSFDRPPALRVLRRLRMTGFLLLGFLVSVILTVGAYDWLTWGAPFQSLIKFAHLTLVTPDFASRVKYQAPWWYFANLVRWCSPLLLPLLWYARRRRVIWFVAIPLLAFSAVRHKELRYLQVMIPFLAIAAAIGYASMVRSHRRVAIVLVTISLIWDLHGLRYFARKSQPAVEAAEWIAQNPTIHSVAASQLWSYGDKLYLGDKMAMSDLGTPPEKLSEVTADAVGLYETDLDVPARVEALRANGYAPVRTFRDDPARAVVVFMKK